MRESALVSSWQVDAHDGKGVRTDRCTSIAEIGLREEIGEKRMVRIVSVTDTVEERREGRRPEEGNSTHEQSVALNSTLTWSAQASGRGVIQEGPQHGRSESEHWSQTRQEQVGQKDGRLGRTEREPVGGRSAVCIRIPVKPASTLTERQSSQHLSLLKREKRRRDTRDSAGT